MAEMKNSIHTCRGSDLSRQLFVGKKPERNQLKPIHMQDCTWNHDRSVQYSYRPLIKPGGGLWTSTVISLAPPMSDWLRWCNENYQDGDRSDLWVLMPEAHATVLVIDTVDDLVAAMQRFPHQRGYRLSREELDHVAIEAAGYDGVHLTEEGQWRTRLSMPFDLYGWDCECTIWYRWAFIGEAMSAVA